MTLNYEIISTGSKGNCVIIENVMIDCGVPIKNIKDKLYDIKYLLLTHIHSDHIKESTLRHIKKLFPRITIIGNYEVYQHYGVDILANLVNVIETDDYSFKAFECVHDVVTYGYTWEAKGKSILYATDTSSMDNAPSDKFDYIFLESNHDATKVNAIRFSSKYGYNAYAGAKRHLSTQSARAFYFTHRKSKESEFIELHQSSRFY